MEIFKIAAIAAVFAVEYPEFSETEKGFAVSSRVLAEIEGRKFDFSGLGQAKTLPSAAANALKGALALFDGIDFSSLTSAAAALAPLPSESEVAESALPPAVPAVELGASSPLPVPDSPAAPSEGVEGGSDPDAAIPPMAATEPDYIALSTKEIARLGWTSQQGRDYLLQTYGKASRQLLGNREKEEFYRYLKTLPPSEPVGQSPATREEIASPLPSSNPAEAEAKLPATEMNGELLVTFASDGERALDFQQIVRASNYALQILAISSEEAKAEVMRTYNKCSRQLLSDGELIEYANNLIERARKKLGLDTAVAG